jgi:uncharacterized membrane protein YdjX (TVP38/TMEM64 family)
MILFNYYPRLHFMTERQQKIFDITLTILLVGFLVWAFLSFFQGELAFDLFANDSVKFKNYIIGLGPWAEAGYIAAVMLEVLIAFIPGWFVYPVGGAVFGLWQTILLVLLGNFLAASISFWIGRKWGLPLLNKFISKRHISQFDQFMEKRGALSIFLLKLNPVTSFDLWNYLAGASPVRFWKFSLANILGILPLVIFSSLLGEESVKIAPQLLGVLVLLTSIYIFWFIINLSRKLKKDKI